MRLPEPEVWNHFDLTSVYHACEIFHIRVVKFAKARCMLMNVDNSCHVLSAYTSMTYARGKQNSSISLKAITIYFAAKDINKFDDLLVVV